MSNALHDYARLFERYAANNGGTGAILAGEDCLSLANEMRMDADAIDAENAKLRELVKRMHRHIRQTCGECDGWYCSNFDEDNECCVYDTLARELGVEVYE